MFITDMDEIKTKVKKLQETCEKKLDNNVLDTIYANIKSCATKEQMSKAEIAIYTKASYEMARNIEKCVDEIAERLDLVNRSCSENIKTSAAGMEVQIAEIQKTLKSIYKERQI